MYPDDVFRNELIAVRRNLSDWAHALKDAAAFDIKEGAGYWRISARPATPGACPMTLVLRDDQKFDLALAGERFEDREIDDFALFAAIGEAVAAGRVDFIRTWSAATGALMSVQTRVTFKDGSAWSQTRRAGPLKNTPVTDEDVESIEPFLPYAR
ncbi:MAG TPA: hypothetical protein PKD49_13235 [Hyphomicrobium sp.]|nr:hypothetical protein [Hyphomicrobium sp.]